MKTQMTQIGIGIAALVAGADSLLLNRFLPSGRGLSHPELMLTADDVRHAADVAEEVLSRAYEKYSPSANIFDIIKK